MALSVRTLLDTRSKAHEHNTRSGTLASDWTQVERCSTPKLQEHMSVRMKLKLLLY